MSNPAPINDGAMRSITDDTFAVEVLQSPLVQLSINALKPMD